MSDQCLGHLAASPVGINHHNNFKNNDNKHEIVSGLSAAGRHEDRAGGQRGIEHHTYSLVCDSHIFELILLECTHYWIMQKCYCFPFPAMFRTLVFSFPSPFFHSGSFHSHFTSVFLHPYPSPQTAPLHQNSLPQLSV